MTMQPNSFEMAMMGVTFPALLVPKRQAFDAIGVGNSTGYALINQGQLVARKMGKRTMIEAESLRRFVASLPTLPLKAAA